MERAITYTGIVFNIAIYILAFWASYSKEQDITIYVIYLTIQVLFLVMQKKRVGYVGGNDAAGNAMEAGLLFLLYLCFQAAMLIIVLVTFIWRTV